MADLTVHKVGRFIGEHKYRAVRMNGYLIPIMFVSTSITAIETFGLSLWWGLLALPVYGILYWLENQAVTSGEFHYQNSKNEEWQEALKILRELRSKNEQSLQ